MARCIADLTAIVLAFALVYHLYVSAIRAGIWVWGAEPPDPLAYARLTAVFGFLALTVFWYMGLYRARASVLNLWELETAAKGVALAGAFFLGALFFFKMEGFSRTVVVASIPATMVLIILERRVLSGLGRRLQLQGALGRRTLIYGCGTTGQLLMKKIVQATHRGTTVVGFLDDNVPVGSTVGCRITQSGATLFQASVVGRFEELAQVVSKWRVDELLIAASLAPRRLRQVMDVGRGCGLEVGVVPCLIGARADQLIVEDLSAIPVLRPRPPRATGLYRIAKRLFDLLFGSIALLLTSPLWALAALLIRLDSPGPVFFTQERTGLRGRRFRILKFRTMRSDTNPYDHSPVGDVDPRITTIGRLLRVGGLDELPQLINVLRGDMSLVGPRPEMPFIVDGYTEAQRMRLNAKPGITGLWQVSADRHAEIHENMEYDLYYIDNQSLLLDLLILVETILFTCGVLLQNMRGWRMRRTLAALPESLQAVPVAFRAMGGRDALVTAANEPWANGAGEE